MLQRDGEYHESSEGSEILGVTQVQVSQVCRGGGGGGGGDERLRGGT